jgi:hypothetical protein
VPAQRGALPPSAWLRERLFPRGEHALLIAAYAVILTALITFILWQPDLPTWRFAGAILALTALLVLYVTGPDLEARWGEVTASRAQLLLGATLFLVASWLGQIGTHAGSAVVGTHSR